MGGTVTARCICGFEASNIPIGGGRANYETYCAFPVFCRNCKRLGVSNLLEGHAESQTSKLTEILRWWPRKRKLAEAAPKCSGCGSEEVLPYDSTELTASAGELVESWNVERQLGRELVLTNGQYLCPTCGKFELTFERSALHWD